MVYAHRVLHLFLGLFIFYVIVFLVAISLYIAQRDAALIIPVLTNKYILLRFSTSPIFIGMIGALILAFAMRWSYRSRIEDDFMYARNTYGVLERVALSDIRSVRFFHIPLMGFARLTKSEGRALWVTPEAGLALKQT